MNLRRIFFILFALGALLTAGSAFIAATPANAQVDAGLAEVGQTVKLSSTDPRTIAVRIINIALGVIGIVLVALILYAGFIWMTSAGEPDKVGKAKKILINAVIGLVIILSAWAITRFVIERLLQATQEGGGVTGTGSGYTGGLGGSTGTSFRVKSITPQGATPLKPRNVEVKIIFTKNVDEASAGAIAVIKDGGTTVGGSVQVDGSLVTFTPADPCPTPNETRKCFDANSTFLVKVGNTVKSTGGQTVTCGGFAPACEASFSTGNLVDVSGPKVNITYPTEGMPVKENFLVDVLASASDDSGVALVKFYDGASVFALDGPNTSSTPLALDAKGVWDTAGAARGQHNLSAEAYDLDANTTKSASVSVVVRALHCFNGVPDPGLGETGTDCGGDPNSPEFCGACNGGACTSNSQCSSGFCLGGTCVEKPIIKSVSPLNGKAGTFVSISGFNFGTSTGAVKFLGDPNNPADDKVAVAPQACASSGAKTWTNTQAIVAVPEGAASGPIELVNAASNLADRTDQDPGPAIPSFVVDNSEHPGLCAVMPPEDTVNKEVDAIGSGLGATPGTIIFGSSDYQLQASPWSDSKAHFKVPVVNNGGYQVWAKTAAGLSNGVEFTVVEKLAGEGPQLNSIDATVAPQQEYVTLTGKNFGYTVGTVIFTGETANGPLEAVGDTSFPAACASGFWRDDSIVVKVPSKFKNGEATTDGKYQVKVKPVRPDNKESNSLDFTLDNKLVPKPGICAIQPAIGPEGTVVKLFGDRFGTDKPTVTFNPSKNSLVDSNTNQEIKTSVPKNAATGPVKVLAQLSQGATTSNAVNFQVRNCNEAPEICGPPDKFQCCPKGECRAANEACEIPSDKAEFAWQMSTGLIPLAPYVIEECRPDLNPAPTPSPSPWLNRAGGDQAPVDAQITMRFSQNLEPTTVKASNFKLYACTAAKDDPCGTKTDVPFTFGFVPGDGQDSVTLWPTDKLAVNTTYLVTVSTQIKGKGTTGAFMLERQDCGAGPNGAKLGYCFRFKTRDNAEPSQISSVGVIPPVFTFHETGVNTQYQAQPQSLNDKCIIINCNLFSWAWATGDTRGYVSNKKSEKNYGLCQQLGHGNAETGDVPVDVKAALEGTGIQGLGRMYVNFVPPKVIAYAPNCDAACNNALVWARFSSELDPNSVSKPGNVVIRKCFNENCYETELSEPLALTGLSADAEGGTEIQVDHANFEPGVFYWVLLRGGPNAIGTDKANDGIKGKYGIPMTGTNHPKGFVWKFRVNVGQGAFCKAERIDVKPVEKFELNIDARQLFAATPVSKPDACDANGQKLVSSGPVDWVSTVPAVADLYRLPGLKILTATDVRKLPLGCSGKCLATGSGGLYGKLAICGNKIIETTDKNFCKKRNGQSNTTTPKGDACTLFAPGSMAGEECEPGIDGEDLCSKDTCLFKPVPLVTSGGTCGDGHVVESLGEACDFGTVCVGGSSATSSPAVPEYSLCGTAPGATVTKQACENAGGTCSMFDYRGCSAGCRHLGSTIGKSTCGNNDVLGDGKDCDDGNKTDGDGCSSNCLHEASAPATEVAAVCGNGALEPGETCEAQLINNSPVFPAGCDPFKCLHTGTLACSQGETAKCCGNGFIDQGEDCDDGNSSKGDGCSASCMLEGSSAYYSGQGAIAPSFCGNGRLEQGEQCEIEAPSNLVAQQLNYPALYLANPPKSGFAAFAPVLNKTYPATPPSMPDRLQLAYIVGNAEPEPETGRASTTLQVTMMDQTGRATYGLQCGQTDESACEPDGQGQARGLDKFGCCRARPYAVHSFPVSPVPQTVPPTTFCRNVQISVEFKDPMDSGSVVNNFKIAQVPGANNLCPSGTSDLIIAKEGQPAKGWWNKLKAWWSGVIAWFTGAPTAQAEKWCVGGITGQLKPVGNAKAPSKFTFNLDRSLPANSTFRVILKGDPKLTDNSDKNMREGIKTLLGVVYDATNGDYAWTFQTNDKICAVNLVTIDDVTGLHQTPPPPEQPGDEHPFLFINPGNQPEYRDFEAIPQSLVNGAPIPLSSTDEYQWSWQAWTTSNPDLVSYSDAQYLPESTTAQFRTQQKGTTSQLNGTAILTAGLQVVKDTVNIPTTSSTTIYGSAPVTVLACENPWPSLNTAPFQDTDAWLKDKFPLVYQAQYVFTVPDPLVQNFSTMYCRDDGEEHNTLDDLKALQVNPVPRTQADKDKGILRQYLLTFKEPELKQDGIGIRIMENPMHLSPREWYSMQGFVGSPKEVKVDGYPALQDGPSIYVAAANQPKKDGPIYSNIYIISHNQNAVKNTLVIYDQLVKYLTFNINILGQSNTCHQLGSGSQYEESTVYLPQTQGLKVPVNCTADFECLALDSSVKLFCDANKLKMARDTQRMADFQEISRKLALSFDFLGGKYPQLTSGTFIKGMTNSVWTSWKDELGKQLSGAMPTDPTNRFLTCGRCANGVPCQTSADCAGQSTTTCMGGKIGSKVVDGKVQLGVWVEDPQIDPQTCWNTKEAQYVCPRYDDSNPFSVSRIYQFRSFAGGTQYELGSEFEIRPLTAGKQDWWYPPLSELAYRCFNTSTYGQYCANANGQADDKLCRKCSNPNNCKWCKTNTSLDCTSDANVCPNKDCIDVPYASGSCRPVGGSFKYADICTNLSFAENGVCGDGIKNTASKICSASFKACATNADCGTTGGTCMTEACELGETKSVPCATDPLKPTVKDGHQLQTCVACTKFDVDPKQPQCVPDVKCGNGRIDKHCAMTTTQSCMSSDDCPPLYKMLIPKGFGTPSFTIPHEACVPAETCDDGVLNGTYGHCAVGCGGYGGFCGNGQLDGGEVCDNGPANGSWSNKQNPASCSLDCKGIGAYCGDQTVQQPSEDCDGQTETSQKALCQNTSILCDSNADCPANVACGTTVAPGSGGTPQLVDAQKQNVKADKFADCSKLFVLDAQGGLRPTQRVRNCLAPGGTPACKWDVWTACIPVGICGDGIKEPNEECDNGQQNGNTKPCTAECKKNVCGDGNLNTGVEECDSGAQNGQATCNADYGSSCLSCSPGCKFMASAGGYCGDGMKNGPEQCDGTEGLKDAQDNDVTCKMLGYDYAEGSTQQFSAAEIETVAADFAWAGSGTPSGGAKSSSFDLLNSQYTKILDTTKSYKYWAPGTSTPYNFQLLSKLDKSSFLTIFGGTSQSSLDPQNIVLGTSSSLIKKVGGVAGGGNITNSIGSLVYGPGFWSGLGGSSAPAYNPEAAKCTNACSFGGCRKCALDPGKSVIKGRIYDAVFQQVVANARVTLTYKGTKVDETYSDMNGVFTFKTLNANKACDSYKIVIDMYEDNPCTAQSKGEPPESYCYRTMTPPWTYPYDIDESKQGGYFPFTSQAFTVADFVTVANGTDADQVPHLDIFPRPERGMAYAAISWSPVAGKVGYKLHTVLPNDYAFTSPIPNGDWDKDSRIEKCNYAQRPVIVNTPDGNGNPQDYWWDCMRDIFHYNPGKWDTGKFPYTRLICLHRAGEKTAGWIDPKGNGCPIEGYEQCIKNQGKTASQCSMSSTSDAKCSACGLDANHVDQGKWTCFKEPRFADCANPMTFSPLTSLVNFAPMVASQEDEPVRFYFVAGDGSSNDLKNLMASTEARFTAYTALTKLNGTSEIKPVAQPSGTGWAWHIADLDPKTQEMKAVNTLEGQDGTQAKIASCLGTTADYRDPAKAPNCQKSIAGLAAWSYWFQASGSGGYCVTNPNLEEENAMTWLLGKAGVCWQDPEIAACQAAGNTCKDWSYHAWTWANY